MIKRFNENFQEDFEEDFDWEEHEFHLKSKKEVIYEVDYYDFEKLVMDYYKPPIGRYEFAADMECGNDTYHKFHVTGKEKEYDWDKKKLEEFRKKGKYNYLAPYLINDLCRNGIIEPATYMINVSW